MKLYHLVLLQLYIVPPDDGLIVIYERFQLSRLRRGFVAIELSSSINTIHHVLDIVQ